MRRQARISGGGALVVRSASALQVWLWLLIFIFQNEFRISRSIQPGYLDFDNLPETNFTCAGKVIGGYYADLETSCQMFHVCTVGQQEEPMDIKFLCLNGTVFDQETRVCERVDEVDCTKSEKFYSLNLELYGSTAPPIIQPDKNKPKAQITEKTRQQTKPTVTPYSDPTIQDTTVTNHDKIPDHSQEIADSTEDPVQDINKNEPVNTHSALPTITSSPDNEELTEEYHEDADVGDYEDYSPVYSTSSTQEILSTTTTSTTTTTTTKRPPPSTTKIVLPTTPRYSTTVPHFISSAPPVLSSLSSPSSSPFAPLPSIPSLPSAAPITTIDPSLLSPQEFIYRHRGPGSEAISFQRQSFRPADGVYITHAPPQQFDHFQYESSRTVPRPAVLRPAPFVQRPQPTPFRPTTIDPRDQLLRPGPSSQPSERHETAIRHRPQNYPVLPAQRPLPFNPYYYDRKRSNNDVPENESTLTARSVAPVTHNIKTTERPPVKLKSPPRVIVTASASVSDSNGKRLNYTVGNVVSAVKPIVPINYDDYKETDLIFDPFFLDVPKLQKRRKGRSSRVFTVPATTTVSSKLKLEKQPATSSPVTSRATTPDINMSSTTIISSTIAWNPNDYVDDNYEPHGYAPQVPPLAILVPRELNKYKKPERTLNDIVKGRVYKPKVGHIGDPMLTSSSAALIIASSQSVETSSASASLQPPPPIDAPACVPAHSAACQTRA